MRKLETSNLELSISSSLSASCRLASSRPASASASVDRSRSISRHASSGLSEYPGIGSGEIGLLFNLLIPSCQVPSRQYLPCCPSPRKLGRIHDSTASRDRLIAPGRIKMLRPFRPTQTVCVTPQSQALRQRESRTRIDRPPLRGYIAPVESRATASILCSPGRISSIATTASQPDLLHSGLPKRSATSERSMPSAALAISTPSRRISIPSILVSDRSAPAHPTTRTLPPRRALPSTRSSHPRTCGVESSPADDDSAFGG